MKETEEELYVVLQYCTRLHTKRISTKENQEILEQRFLTMHTSPGLLNTTLVGGLLTDCLWCSLQLMR